MKPSTELQQLKKFEKWGISKSIVSIEKSILNGWTGIFPPDDKDMEQTENEEDQEFVTSFKGRQ